MMRTFFYFRLVGFLFIFMHFLFMLFGGSVTVFVVSAENVETTDALYGHIQELLSQLDLQALQAYVDSLDGITQGSVVERLFAYIQGETFSYQNFLTEFTDVLFLDVKRILPTFATITAIALLSGLLSMLKSGTMTGSTDVIFLICYASAAVPLIGVLTQCFSCVFESIQQMQTQMQIVYPILLTLMAANGATMSVAICKPMVAFLSNGIIAVVTTVILPLTIAIIAFSMANNISKELKISKCGAFFKSINKWIIGVCISVFGLFFTLQGITAATHDGIVRRAAKYALGNGVPIVGGFLSGGFDLAIAGGILIKNALGSMSIFLLVAIIFKPLVLLITVNVLLRFTAAVTQPFGDSRISDFLGETADNLQYCTAALLFTAFMYFLSVLLIVNTSGALL